ncbi:CIR protein, partial [Plasmodium chabaudi adami]
YGMKGQEGGYLGILEDITSLRNGFPGLNGGSNGKHNALSSKSSESEIIGGIIPRIKMLYDSIKGISGQSQILKGEEGDVDGHHDVLIGRTKGLKGKEGDINGQRNILSSKSSEFKIIGGINPQIQMLQDSMKGTKRRTKRFADQEDGPQVVFGGVSGLSGLKGEEGDINGKYDGLKGQEGGYLGISEDITSLRDGFPVTKGYPNGKDNVLSVQGSVSEIISGITPKINISYDSIKGISGQSQILKGEEGDVDGKHDILIGRKTGFKGKEGDINGQHNVLSRKSSEFEITGGITPKMNISYDSMKGMSGHAQILKYEEDSFNGQYDALGGRTKGLAGQKGESQAVLGGSSDLKGRLKGAEGDSYGQPDVLKGKTHGLSGQEGELRDKIHGLPDQKGEPKVVLGGYSDLKGKLKGEEGDINGKYYGLKGQEGGYLGILEDITSLRDGFPGLNRGSNGKHNTLSSKSSESEIIGGIIPRIKMLYDSIKGISGQTHELPGKEGELIGQKGGSQAALWGYSDSKGKLSGLEGNSYDQSDGLSGKTLGLPGQDGVSLGISGGHPNLRDNLSGLEGDLSGQHNVLSINNSGLEITGGITPKMNISYDSMKGVSGQSQILKGEEGDFNGKHDILIGRKTGFKGKEGDLDGQRNILSSKSSEFEIIGGMNPQIKILQDDMKGTRRRAKRFADQEDGSQVVCMCFPGLRNRLKGEEGDFNGKYYGLKGQEGGYLGILEDITSLRGRFPVIKGGINGKDNVLSSQNSGLEITGGITPKMNISYDSMKGVSGQSQILKGEEGDFNGKHDVLIGRKTGFKGKEGDINGQHNVLSRKNSEFEITGGITPKMNISYDSMKGVSGQAQILKYEEDNFNGQYDVLSGRTKGLKGEEGDFYGQSDGFKGKTYGLPGQEGELTDLAHEFKDEDGSVYIEDYLSHFTIESQSISTTTEENTNLSQNFPILLTINPLEDSTSGSNSDSTPILTSGSNPTLNSDSNSFSIFGNKITYILVAFISFFIILGVSYKYFAPGWKKKLKREQNVKKIINLCDKNKPTNEVPDTIIEDN